MDQNNYELMRLTHIGQSRVAFGFNSDLKKSYATWGKDSKGNECLKPGKQKTTLSQVITTT